MTRIVKPLISNQLNKVPTPFGIQRMEWDNDQAETKAQ